MCQKDEDEDQQRIHDPIIITLSPRLSTQTGTGTQASMEGDSMDGMGQDEMGWGEMRKRGERA